jgi:hypothetical protein
MFCEGVQRRRSCPPHSQGTSRGARTVAGWIRQSPYGTHGRGENWSEGRKSKRSNGKREISKSLGRRESEMHGKKQ